MSDLRPTNCRFRLEDEGKAYPRSGCKACGKTITTGLGTSCSMTTPQPKGADELLADDHERYRDALALVMDLSPKQRRDLRAAIDRFATADAGRTPPSVTDEGIVERAFREGFTLGDFAGGGQADPRTVDLSWQNSHARAALQEVLSVREEGR